METARLNKQLDTILAEISELNRKFAQVIRLEERVENHHEVLSRFGTKIDTHDERLHQVELSIARAPNSSATEKRVESISRQIDSLENKIHGMDNYDSKSEGRKEVVSKITKWVMGVVAAILIFHLTAKDAKSIELEKYKSGVEVHDRNN